QARPRDTNLKVAVGRAAGLRTLHAIPGTGLSTFDPQIAARHQAAGWEAHETVVPVLTLTKILEDCGLPTIHFLKIDVEGAEAEVVESLNLDQVRPWIIVIEATEPFSTVSTRNQWEHLITDRGYGFAYFDGLNCFYVFNEMAGLKGQLAVPPNVFDDFVRFPDWSIRQEVAKLEQEMAGLRGHSAGLERALQAEQAQAANLRNALQAEQAQNANLQGRIHQLEAQLAVPSIDRAIGRALRRLRETGDRLTGGGLRSLAKRVLTTSVQRSMRNRWLLAFGRAVLKPFPKLTTNLYQLAITADAVARSSVPSPAAAPAVTSPPAASPAGQLPSDNAEIPANLPASARRIYRRLKAAMADSDAWTRNQ
ncbi:MAG: FkbM family methyltransferase, partial [Chthoniobacterales bacterium]